MFDKTGGFSVAFQTTDTYIDCPKHGRQLTIEKDGQHICMECYKESLKK